jgi:hypothetical protein
MPGERDMPLQRNQVLGWLASACLALAAAGGAPALAQGYARVPAVLDGPPVADPGFDASRAELLAIVLRADREALNKRVARDFFWDRDHGGGFDRKRPAAANLAAAADWKSLRRMLSAETATPRSAGSRDYCSPAGLRAWDERQLERVAEQLGTDPFFDWGGVASDRQAVRSGPAETAPEIGTLSRELVRVTDWAFETPEGRQRWVAVVTPAGRKGFVDGRRIQTLAEERLCLRKDGGVWRISGYIGGGD